MKKTPYLLPIAAALLSLAAIAPPARAGETALVPVSLHLAPGLLRGGVAVPCRDGAIVEKASAGDARSMDVSAYAARIGFCEGRVSVLESDPGEASLTYLPTRVMPDGAWVSEADGARLVRAMSPGLRDLDFQPAEALGTRGPDAVVEAYRQDGEPEGFLITTDDPQAARWYRSATAWIGDPDRLAVGGASVLATCSSLTETCLVTVPVCADVAVGFEARGVRDPSALGPAIRRAHRDAASGLRCAS